MEGRWTHYIILTPVGHVIAAIYQASSVSALFLSAKVTDVFRPYYLITFLKNLPEGHASGNKGDQLVTSVMYCCVFH
jgi:hypothetical protein